MFRLQLTFHPQEEYEESSMVMIQGKTKGIWNRLNNSLIKRQKIIIRTV